MSAAKKPHIAIVGLGYVGLPLAIEFAKQYQVLGFDINEIRINELSVNEDITREADLVALQDVLGKGLELSSEPNFLKDCNVDYAKYRQKGAVIFDTKSFIDRKYADARL